MVDAWMDLAIDIGNVNCDANDVSTLAVQVHDVVTDWSYALAGLLVSMLFGVSLGQS